MDCFIFSEKKKTSAVQRLPERKWEREREREKVRGRLFTKRSMTRQNLMHENDYKIDSLLLYPLIGLFALGGWVAMNDGDESLD